LPGRRLCGLCGLGGEAAHHRPGDLGDQLAVVRRREVEGALVFGSDVAEVAGDEGGAEVGASGST
jgi:hypothetical protein